MQIENWWVLHIHETFLVYKLETFKNCKEVKNIMMMIIAIICIILLPDISVNLLLNFQKGWAWQDLSFKRGFSGKEGEDDFF